MLPRRIAAARPLSLALRHRHQSSSLPQLRRLTTADPTKQEILANIDNIDITNNGDLSNEQLEAIDPDQNGMYPNPPPVRRQFRDPYHPWFDRQDRRDYGEVVHEDNDILTVFTPEAYTHFRPGWAGVLFGTWVASVFALAGVVGVFYPDKPSVPRTFEAGLEEELGGKGAMRARKPGEEVEI